MAWQVCLLADHFDCPDLLQQCEAYVKASMETADPHTTEGALQWIDLADRLKLRLKVTYAKLLAKDFDNAQQLSCLSQLLCCVS